MLQVLGESQRRIWTGRIQVLRISRCPIPYAFSADGFSTMTPFDPSASAVVTAGMDESAPSYSVAEGSISWSVVP